MDALLNSAAGDFRPVLALVLFWNVVAVFILLWKRRKRGLVLPKVTDQDVVFFEKFASGSSHKSWMTRLGGASNCLTVIVTKSHLAVTTFFPLTAFAGLYDLEHLVPISDITGLTHRGRSTEVEFQLSDGTRGKFSLRLRRTEDFLKALGNGNKSESSARSR